MDEITQYSDFVNTVQEVMNNCEVRETSPHDLDVWEAFGSMDQRNFFVMKRGAGYYYFRGRNYIRKELERSQVTVSEDYVTNRYTKFIEDHVRNGGSLSDDCQAFLDDIKSLRPIPFKFLIPISHYDYRCYMDLGKVRIVRLDDQLLKNEFGIKSELAEIANTEMLTEFNYTCTYAIVNLESRDKTHAKESAFRLIERFIYAVKLIDPYSFARLRKHSMNEVKECVLVRQGTEFGTSFTNHRIVGRVNPGPQFYADLQPYWDKLAEFLYSDSPNDLQGIILSALYWYGEADIHADSRVKLYSNLITGLEWVVLHIYDKSFGKADKFGTNCAIVLSGDEQHHEFWKNYYEKRNNLAHQKLVEIYKEDIDTLRLQLRMLLLKLIDFTDNYTTLSDVFSNEFGILET